MSVIDLLPFLVNLALNFFVKIFNAYLLVKIHKVFN